MLRRVLIICGTILLLGSIGLGCYIFFVITNGTRNAVALDSSRFHHHHDGHMCTRAISWDVNVPNRVMAESDTQDLTVTFSNTDKASACDESVQIAALKFDFSPNEPIRNITIPPGESRSLHWVLGPRELGTLDVTVSISDPDSYKKVGITVTNIFGLTIWQAQLLSYLGTLVGVFLGPVLSFPWWYSIWQKHHRKRKKTRPSSQPKKRARHKP